ncbi:MAG: glutamate carboxypeptidase [Arenicella sp.]|jgi:glutamate carboxypeptidase
MLKRLSSIAVVSLSLIASSALAQPETLSEQELRLISWVDKNQDQILTELKSHVEINTGTANIDGLNLYRDLLSADLAALGFSTETHSSSDIKVLSCKGGSIQIADHLVAKRSGSAKNRVLMNGHMDTVFSKDDEFQTLNIADDGVLKGPGVADMKGGIVIMINALRALHAQGLLDDTNLTVLFNSDEEIGSLGSRQLIEELARQHDIGLVFEGSYNNLATRARKGLGQVRLRVTGRESHAGGAHEEGVSATLELAHKVIEIEKLTDYSRKVTVNTGVLSGGEKRNTVPGCADAYIDMRFPSLEAGQQLEQSVKRIADAEPVVKNAKYPDLPIVESWAVLHRPVKPENAKVDEIIAQAMALSALIGEPITGTRYSGGGTDGSIAQGVGLPTMDSLGMDGKGAHSSREESTVQSLIARTKLAAVMLARQLHQ